MTDWTSFVFQRHYEAINAELQADNRRFLQMQDIVVSYKFVLKSAINFIHNKGNQWFHKV